MKKSISIILILVLSKVAVSQNEEINYPLLKKNQFEVELDFISVSGIYNRKMGDKFSIGTGFGLGLGSLNLFIYKPDKYPKVLGDGISLKLFGSYYYSRSLKFELGVKSAFAMLGKNQYCEECGTIYTSGFLSILFGLKHFKVGTRIEITSMKIGNSNSNVVLLLNPIFLRIIF